MAENIAFRITGDAGPITESVKSLKAQLREATEDVVRLSQEFGSTSQQAVAAARSAAGLREQIADSRDLIAAFHPEQKFQAFGAAIQGVAGGFSALTGAMGLFGADSENLQKTLVKVQSAMALSEGINSILSAKDAFMNLGAVLKGPVVAAFNFLKMAMMTNPIIFLATVLISIVLAFKRTRDAIINFIPGLKQVAEFVGNVIDTVKEWIGATDSAAEAQEKLKEATDELNQSLDKEIQAMDKNTARLKLHAEFAGKSASDIAKIDADAIEGKKKFYTDNLELAKKMHVYSGALQAEFDKKMADLRDEEMKQEISRRRSHSTATKAIVKQKVDEEVALEMGAVDRIQARVQAFNDWQARQKQAEDLAKAEVERLKIEKEKADDDRNKALTEKLKTVPNEILERNAKEVKLNQEAADAKIEIDRRTEAAKFDIIDAGLNAVAEIVGKNSVAGKAIAVAQAIINTYLGVTKAIGSYAPPFNFIAAAATAVAGFLNVKKIISTKIPGQSGGGGGSVPSASAAVPAPLAPTAQVTNTRIDQQQVNAMGNATTRSFVVESDITTSQDRIRRLNRAARI